VACDWFREKAWDRQAWSLLISLLVHSMFSAQVKSTCGLTDMGAVAPSKRYRICTATHEFRIYL
jgi:hypothetical protein